MFYNECISPVISIILPLYNASKYIYETLKSIQNQTFEDFEVIIIDDGSFDGSKEICQKFIKSDDRFHLYSKKNAGISNTRNFAIKLARGTYIAFCDHDDLMDSLLLEELYRLCEANNADVSYANYNIEYVDKNNNCVKKEAKIGTNTYTKDEIIRQFPYVRKNLQSVWNGLYKKKLLINNNIYFDETMRFGGEDITFNYRLIQFADKISTTEKILYYHFKRSGQSTSTILNRNRINAILKFSKIQQGIIENLIHDYKWMEIVKDCEWMANLSLILTVLAQSEAPLQDKIDELIRLKKMNFIKKDIKINTYIFMIKKFPKRLIAVILYRLKLYYILLGLSTVRTKH